MRFILVARQVVDRNYRFNKGLFTPWGGDSDLSPLLLKPLVWMRFILVARQVVDRNYRFNKGLFTPWEYEVLQTFGCG